MKVLIPKCALSLVNCIGDAGKYTGALQSVLVKAGGGRHRCEATNGRSLAIINGTSITNGKGNILIPHKSLTDVKKLFDKTSDSVEVFTNDGRHAELMPCNSKTGSTTGSLKTEINPLRDPESKEAQPDALVWPNTDSILRMSSKPIATRNVDPKLLIDLLRVAIAVMESGDNLGVEITIYESKSAPLGLSCRNADGTQFFDGLLMPLHVIE